ncbi:M14 family zinc carboxypeptidase [Metabacillus sp. HB246100]
MKLTSIFSIFLTILMFTIPCRAIQPPIYTYESLTKELRQLASKDEIEVKIIGKSEFDRNLYAVRLGHGKKNVLITGSHHGREWLSTHIIMNMIHTYVDAYQSKDSLRGHSLNIVDRVSIWFVPMVNPDGVTIQQKGVNELPYVLQEILFDMNNGDENYKRWKANGLGVDLNRQYPAGWETIQGSPRNACYSHYKGKNPLEAKEARALATFTNEINPMASLAYHTSGREIYWYYYNELDNLERDLLLVDTISTVTGYDIAYPPATAFGGGYTDWFIKTFKKPALTLELSYLVEETNPPLSVLREEWERNKEVGLLLAEFADSYLDEERESTNE